MGESIERPVFALMIPPSPGRVFSLKKTHFHYRCMDMISSEEVARRISLYFDGGTVKYLSAAEIEIAARTVPSLRW